MRDERAKKHDPIGAAVIGRTSPRLSQSMKGRREPGRTTPNLYSHPLISKDWPNLILNPLCSGDVIHKSHLHPTPRPHPGHKTRSRRVQQASAGGEGGTENNKLRGVA